MGGDGTDGRRVRRRAERVSGPQPAAGHCSHSQQQDTARAAADRERGGTTESTHCFFAAENMGIEKGVL